MTKTLLTVAHKEFRETIRDGRLRTGAIIVLALLTTSLAVGWQQFRESSAERDAARRSVREQWLDQAPKNPHTAAHYGMYAFKPSTPLSMADSGVDRYTGVALFLEPHKQNDFRFRPAQDATPLERFGQLTAAITLEVLVPLLIVMLTFASFAGELEEGTMRQILSTGVRARDLAWGKLLGSGAALAILLLPAAALGAGALALVGAAGTPTTIPWQDTTVRAICIAVAFTLYFAALTGISLAVSAMVRSSRVALVILLACWVGNCLMGPRACADIAARLHPAGSAFERFTDVNREIREGPDGHNPNDPRWDERKRELLVRYHAKNLNDLPINFDGIALVEAEKFTSETYARHVAQLQNVYKTQERFYQDCGLVVPMLAVQTLSMGLSGTDFAEQRDLAAAAEKYRKNMAIQMNSYLIDHSRRGDLSFVAGPDLWKTLPDFEYTMPPAGQVLRNDSRSIAVLFAWCVAGLLLAAWASARIKPV